MYWTTAKETNSLCTLTITATSSTASGTFVLLFNLLLLLELPVLLLFISWQFVLCFFYLTFNRLFIAYFLLFLVAFEQSCRGSYLLWKIVRTDCPCTDLVFVVFQFMIRCLSKAVIPRKLSCMSSGYRYNLLCFLYRIFFFVNIDKYFLFQKVLRNKNLSSVACIINDPPWDHYIYLVFYNLTLHSVLSTTLFLMCPLCSCCSFIKICIIYIFHLYFPKSLLEQLTAIQSFKKLKTDYNIIIMHIM